MSARPAKTLFARSRAGQSTVEYLLLISVVVVAVTVVAGTAFKDPFQGGMQDMQDKLATIVESGHVDGAE